MNTGLTLRGMHEYRGPKRYVTCIHEGHYSQTFSTATKLGDAPECLS